jgi:hypothetical protein
MAHSTLQHKELSSNAGKLAPTLCHAIIRGENKNMRKIRNQVK